MGGMRMEMLETRRFLTGIFPGVGQQPIGTLTGKIVYTSAGHGFTFDDTSLWDTQRGETNELVEDLGNQDQLRPFADYLMRAGATIVPMRPVGHQLNEAVVDDQQATFIGTWSAGASTPYFSNSAGAGVKYQTAVGAATETATARFMPTLTAEGFYPVYAWALDGGNRAPDQTYRVVHSGGTTEVKIDHTRVGKGWVYLGTYHFRAGSGGGVEISNKTSIPGRAIIADAVRFGNGMGSIVRAGNTSGKSREDEASLYWIEHGAGWDAPGVRDGSSAWRTSSSDGTATVGAPLRYAAYMNAAPFGQSVYLGWHTNAGGGRGADGLYNRDDLFPGTATPNQFRWAQLVGEEINDDFVALGSPPLEHAFFNAANPTFARTDFPFGEIRGDVNGDEFDATIIEVAFHDDVSDANLLRDPFVRDKAGQSATQATIRYFNEFGGGTLVFAPDAPTHLRTSSDRFGNVTIRWNAPAVSSIYGGAATGYRVYSSRDGYGFDAGQTTATNSLTIPRSQVGSGTVFLKVVATNAGGESPATAVAAVRGGDPRAGRVLLVNGFDRFARSLNPRQTVGIFSTNAVTAGSVVTIDRVRAFRSNSFDYSVQHAQAIANHPARIVVDTANNEAVVNGSVSLAGYRAVVWMLGEESTTNDTFDASEQSLVTTYLNAGGKLMVSGSEIGWDLVAQAGGATFFNNTLRGGYVGDDAGTYNASGAAGSILSGINLTFDNGTRLYDVDSPDRLSAANGSTALLNYVGGTGGVAATRWTGTNGAQSVIFGFPFESIVDAGTRATIMRRLMSQFGFVDPNLPTFVAAPVDGVVLASSATLVAVADPLDTGGRDALDRRSWNPLSDTET
jgi:hypothetical protein